MATKKTEKEQNLIDQLVVFGSSLVYLGKDGADEIVKVLEKNELISTEEGSVMADDIREEFYGRKEELRGHVKKMLKSVIDEFGIATKEDLEDLKKK